MLSNGTQYKVIFEGIFTEFDNCFFEIIFFGKCVPETSKSLVLNETRYRRVFKDANVELTIFFSNLSPKILFYG